MAMLAVIHSNHRMCHLQLTYHFKSKGIGHRYASVTVIAMAIVYVQQQSSYGFYFAMGEHVLTGLVGAVMAQD
jgi:hypothetical protein